MRQAHVAIDADAASDTMLKFCYVRTFPVFHNNGPKVMHGAIISAAMGISDAVTDLLLLVHIFNIICS